MTSEYSYRLETSKLGRFLPSLQTLPFKNRVHTLRLACTYHSTKKTPLVLEENNVYSQKRRRSTRRHPIGSLAGAIHRNILSCEGLVYQLQQHFCKRLPNQCKKRIDSYGLRKQKADEYVPIIPMSRLIFTSPSAMSAIYHVLNVYFGMPESYRRFTWTSSTCSTSKIVSDRTEWTADSPNLFVSVSLMTPTKAVFNPL